MVLTFTGVGDTYFDLGEKAKKGGEK